MRAAHAWSLPQLKELLRLAKQLGFTDDAEYFAAEIEKAEQGSEQ